MNKNITWKTFPGKISPVLILLFALQSHLAAQELTSEETTFFESKIRPVLIKECYGCHSAKTGATKGGLMVDSRDALLRGGDSGPAIVPGDLEESLLFNAMNHEDYNMPPGKMLSDKVLDDFAKWIEMGAPDPRVQKKITVNSTITKNDIVQAKESFWAYKPPVKPSVPAIAKSSWPATEIDHFVLAKLEENELSPARDAEVTDLLRRLTFDLIGLPPTPEQVAWLEKNYKKDPDAAIEHIVDSLLAKPAFGERWGRHWLDLARYAESSGREVNLTYPHAWRYRDYVIDSFNKDKPYDRFLQEQLAGDLLPADTDEQWTEALTATAFLALGPKALAEQNGRQFKLDVIDEQIDVTTRVMLGTSVACARCHDHKFDPIPQVDYYAVAGIFENMTTHYGTIDTLQNRRPSNLLISPVPDRESGIAEPITREELANLKRQLKETADQLAVERRKRIENRRNPDSGSDPQQSIQNVARLATRSGIIEAKINSYDEDGNPYTYLMGVQSVDEPKNTNLLVRGEFNQVAQEVQRGFPEVLCSVDVAPIRKRSSGRLEFARWVGSDQNPLAARVMVNRIWQHLMGQGIVRTPENFGATGSAPTHPELLDYLAVKFVESGWSIKTIVKEIATSRIYRTGSSFDRNSFDKDPENEFLWRFEPKRLDAEALRDSILAISGELEMERPVATIVAKADHALVRDGLLIAINSGQQNNAGGMMRRGGNPGDAQAMFVPLEQRAHFRSVYLPVVRDNAPRSLDVFDFADPSMVVGQRESSNTPDQGLYFLNNDFVIEQCDAMAKRLMKESGNVEEQVKKAFLLAFGRDATRKELQAAEAFYNNFEVSSGRFQRASDQQLKKLSALCQGILASAEFRFLN